MTAQVQMQQIHDEIVKVSKQIRAFRDGPVTERCIVVLLADATGLPKKTIIAVLDGLDGLEERYLKEDQE